MNAFSSYASRVMSPKSLSNSLDMQNIMSLVIQGKVIFRKNTLKPFCVGPPEPTRWHPGLRGLSYVWYQASLSEPGISQQSFLQFTVEHKKHLNPPPKKPKNNNNNNKNKKHRLKTQVHLLKHTQVYNWKQCYKIK